MYSKFLTPETSRRSVDSNSYFLDVAHRLGEGGQVGKEVSTSQINSHGVGLQNPLVVVAH